MNRRTFYRLVGAGCAFMTGLAHPQKKLWRVGVIGFADPGSGLRADLGALAFVPRPSSPPREDKGRAEVTPYSVPRDKNAQSEIIPSSAPRDNEPRAEIGAWALLVHELAKLGYSEGSNLAFERRYTETDEGALRNAAAELVERKVDVILTASGTLGAMAAKKASSRVPIVMFSATEPERNGLVASLARPGGNVTGTSILGPELGAKRIQLLVDTVGKSGSIAYLQHRSARSLPYYQEYRAALERAAVSQGTRLQAVDDLDKVESLETTLDSLARNGVRGIVLDSSAFFNANMRRTAELALRYRLPAIAEGRAYCEAGLLLAYSPSSADLARRAAYYIDKILQGASPADLPVEQPSQFELVVNLGTARAIGFSIPKSVIVLADAVIP